MYIQVSNNYRGTEKAAMEYFQGMISHLKIKKCEVFLCNSSKGYHIVRKVDQSEVFISDYTNSKDYPGLKNDNQLSKVLSEL